MCMKTYIYFEVMRMHDNTYFDIGDHSVTHVGLREEIFKSAGGRIPKLSPNEKGAYDYDHLHYLNKTWYQEESASLIDNSIQKQVEKIFDNPLIFHFHNHLEISIVEQGEMAYIVDRKLVIQKEGDILFIGGNIPHTWAPLKDTKIKYMNIDPSYFERKDADYPDINDIWNSFLNNSAYFLVERSHEANYLATTIFNESYNEFIRKDWGYRAVIRANSINLMVLFGRNYYKNMAKIALAKNSTETAIQTILKYISDNYESHISLGELADLVFMNRTYFSTYFTRKTGMRLNEYITRIRISKAADLLASTSYKVTEIMQKSGFSSIAQFNKSFRKTFSVSPTEYRASIENNNAAG